MSYEVRFSPTAKADLAHVFDCLLERAETLEDLALGEMAVATIRGIVQGQVAATPFSFRKAGLSPARRELIIPFGTTGHVALYEIAIPSWCCRFGISVSRTITEPVVARQILRTTQATSDFCRLVGFAGVSKFVVVNARPAA